MKLVKENLEGHYVEDSEYKYSEPIIKKSKTKWNPLWGYDSDALLLEVIRRYAHTPIAEKLDNIIDEIHIEDVKSQNRDESST